MISRRGVLVLAASAAAVGTAQRPAFAAAPTLLHGGLAHDRAVRSDGPLAFYTEADEARWYDVVGGRHASFPRAHRWTTISTGERIPVFDGLGQFAEARDQAVFSVPPGGAMTVEAWVRPTVLDFPRVQGTGYVHFLGKGQGPGSHEWACRMYSRTNSEQRPNRVSGYAFNLVGGYGAGSYFQDRMKAMGWFHYAFVISRARSSKFPTGYTAIYRDAVLRCKDGLYHYDITPANGPAPLRFGTRDLTSFFPGALGKVAIYGHELTQERISAHYGASPLAR